MDVLKSLRTDRARGEREPNSDTCKVVQISIGWKHYEDNIREYQQVKAGKEGGSVAIKAWKDVKAIV